MLLSEALRSQITGGAYKVGDKLPSEARLTEAHRVSRTVVREAIAALRADGLVEAHRGAGVFVTEPRPDPLAPFRNADPGRISAVIEILELRTAVEVEAAGLAALRRSPAQEERIAAALRAVNDVGDRGEVSATADFDLHLAIAEATGNPRFATVLRMLGEEVIPRRGLTASETPLPHDYLNLLRSEHEAIVAAVLDGDERRARDAMRTHLRGSQSRYRRLLRG